MIWVLAWSQAGETRAELLELGHRGLGFGRVLEQEAQQLLELDLRSGILLVGAHPVRRRRKQQRRALPEEYMLELRSLFGVT